MRAILAGIISGFAAALVNFTFLSIASPVVFGISIYFLNYTIKNINNKERLVQITFIYFLLFASSVFFSVFTTSFLNCQFLVFVSLLCIAWNAILVLLIKEILILFVPWAFLLAFSIRKAVVNKKTSMMRQD